MVTRRHFEVPSDDAKIWRYLDFPGLIHLLHKKALHFTRPDRFPDRFEGSGSRVNWFPSYKTVSEEAPEAIWRERRKSAAINCWHVSEYESLAMWELYARRGLAIQSTFGRLMRGIGDTGKGSPIVGLVEYVNHEKDPMMTPNHLAPLFRKRRSYAYERELRLIVSKTERTYAGPGGSTFEYDPTEPMTADFMVPRGGVPEEGIDVPVAPVTLVEAVYVAPDSVQWIVECVEQVVASLGYTLPVRKSDLDASPIY